MAQHYGSKSLLSFLIKTRFLSALCLASHSYCIGVAKLPLVGRRQSRCLLVVAHAFKRPMWRPFSIASSSLLQLSQSYPQTLHITHLVKSQTSHTNSEYMYSRWTPPRLSHGLPWQGEANLGDSSGLLFSIYSKAAEEEDFAIARLSCCLKTR